MLFDLRVTCLTFILVNLLLFLWTCWICFWFFLTNFCLLTSIMAKVPCPIHATQSVHALSSHRGRFENVAYLTEPRGRAWTRCDPHRRTSGRGRLRPSGRRVYCVAHVAELCFDDLFLMLETPHICWRIWVLIVIAIL